MSLLVSKDVQNDKDADKVPTIKEEPDASTVVRWRDIFLISDLRFHDEFREKAFIASRSHQLGRTTATIAGVTILVVLVLLLLPLEEHPDYPSKAENAMMLLHFIALLVSVTTLIAEGFAWMRMKIGDVGVEAVAITFSYFAILCLVVPVDTYYLPILLGEGEPPHYCKGGNHYSDTPLLLRHTSVLAGTHLVMPLRWAVLWPSEVLALVCFGVATLGLGSPEGQERGVHNLIIVCVTIIGVSIGKRMAERCEREAFTHVEAERWQRLGTERRLTRLSHSGNASDRGDDDEPRTPPSEAVFGGIKLETSSRKVDLEEWTKMNERLTELKNIGMEEQWLLKPYRDLLIPDADVSGSGGFGQLRRGTYHGLQVAIKVALSPDSEAANSRRHLTSVLSLLNELRVFRRVRHPNIVLFHGAYVNVASPEIGIVLEFIDGMTLKAVVQKPPGHPTTRGRCSLMLDVCMAVRYLHAQAPSIVHGDLKAENVLVESKGMKAKVIDFGLSSLVSKQGRVLGCTPAFAAPEIRLRPLECPTPKADVFSFALLACFVVTGEIALQGGSLSEVIAAVVTNKFEEFVKINWPMGAPLVDECKILCINCCLSNPVQRPNMASIQEAIEGWLERACA